MSRVTPIAERLHRRIAAGPNDCHVWTGYVQPKGYGIIGVSASKNALAHRVAYEVANGPIPAGLEVDHLCRNRRCVNPEHLEAVTAQVNQLRSNGMGARNAAKTHCPAGHPLAGDNLLGGQAGRKCKRCHAERERARRAAKVGQ